MDNLTLALGLAGAALIGMLLFLTVAPAPPVPDTPSTAVAASSELARYPELLDPAGTSSLVAVRLPEAARVIVLRPITRGEYNGFQVQAIAPQLIEWQMLAAGVVLPELDELDVTHWPPDLTRFVKAKLNEISGFAVFELAAR